MNRQIEQNIENQNNSTRYLYNRIKRMEASARKDVYSVIRIFKGGKDYDYLPNIFCSEGLDKVKNLASDLCIRIPVRQKIKIANSNEYYISGIKRDPNDYEVRVLDWQERYVAHGVFIEEENKIGWF